MVETEESMSMSSSMEVMRSDIFDPMTPANLQEPFVFFARLRKEKPVYWNEKYSFWMVIFDLLGLPAENHEAMREAAKACLLYTSPSPRDHSTSRMPSSA